MSLVCVLQNMVGPGEVDEDLEGETKEECEKYGKVVKCVIFEVRRPDESTGRNLDSPQCARLSRLSPLPSPQIAEVFDDEAVRIFLEFERVESAIKGQWRPADNKVLLPPPPREARFSLLCLLGSREVGAAPSASPNYCVTALKI